MIQLNQQWMILCIFVSMPNQRVEYLKVKELDLYLTYIPAYFVFEQSDGDFS